MPQLVGFPSVSGGEVYVNLELVATVADCLEGHEMGACVCITLNTHPDIKRVFVKGSAKEVCALLERGLRA